VKTERPTFSDLRVNDPVVISLASGKILTGYVRAKLDTAGGPKIRVTSTDGNRVVTVPVKDVLL
jgi:hypothetical protein